MKWLYLEVTIGSTNSNGDMVAEDLSTNHSQGFALSWVDLSRHDGRARLIFRKKKFAQATTRTGAKQANVICDLEQWGGNGVQCTMALDQGIVCGKSFKLWKIVISITLVVSDGRRRTLFSADTNGSPVILAISAATFSANPSYVLIPWMKD